MAYTIKQLADLAGVSIRTLHYYDEIGLLKPTSYGENGYRYYDEQAVLRLQQILFFRELDFSLDDVKDILDQPEFDVLHALREHRQALEQKVTRLNRLINTVDNTISHLKGELEMSQKSFFEGFDSGRDRVINIRRGCLARLADHRAVVRVDDRPYTDSTAPLAMNEELCRLHVTTFMLRDFESFPQPCLHPPGFCSRSSVP